MQPMTAIRYRHLAVAGAGLDPVEHPMIGKGGSKDADYRGASLPEE